MRAHGLHGELAVETKTDSPEERFAPGTRLATRPPGSPPGTLTVAEARPHSGRMLVRFVEVPDRTAAEGLRGTRLLVGVDGLIPTVDPDEFHVHQLEGLAAELVDGTLVGTVREIVHGPGGELLVLAAPSCPTHWSRSCARSSPPSTSPAARSSSIPPEGLLDLHPPRTHPPLLPAVNLG